ncbi:MAG: hypothetical protein ACE5DQ_01380, partial [Candidatus Paceibacterota bacterium]
GTPRLPGMPHTGGGGSAHEHAVWSSATTNETRKPVKAHLRRDEQVWQWRDTMGQIQMIVLSANKPNLPLEEISSSY